jgi:hypothetical protein
MTVTDAEMGFSDDCKHRLDIRVGADDFDQLRRVMKDAFERCVNNAATSGDLERVLGWGSGTPHYNVAIKFRDDKESRITALRAEADRLEAELEKDASRREALLSR